LNFPELKTELLDRAPSPQERARVEQSLSDVEPVLRRVVDALTARGADAQALLARAQAEVNAAPTVARFQHQFRRLLVEDPNITGRVLDIGCGPEFAAPVTFLADVPRQVDGVDPSDDVFRHPHLQLRWKAPLEAADIPESAYDLAVAYNVLEHLPTGRSFLEKLSRVLKPGGTFWALTPHARHPFSWMSRSLELAGFKKMMAARNPGVNDYPAYYRVNSRRQILKQLDGLPFDPPQFTYAAAPGWAGGYFPRALVWAPNLYDRLLGEPIERLRLILMVKLRKRDA
jgi:SAM-dependent methyltransferase